MNAGPQKRNARKWNAPSELIPFIVGHVYFKWITIVLTVIFIVALFPRGMSFQYADYAIGSVSDKEVIAPFDFPILKSEEELASERKQAEDSIYPYFEERRDVPDSSLILIKRIFNSIAGLRALDVRITEHRTGLGTNPEDSLLIGALKELRAEYDVNSREIFSMSGIDVKEERWEFLLKADRFMIQAFQNQLMHILRDLYALGVIDLNKSEIKSANNQISIMGRSGKMVQTLNNLYDLEESRFGSIK